MILSFNQPSFIPWPGFFARLIASDKMVLLDNTLFAQGFTFVNRNRIKSPEGELWITVPIKKKGLGRQKIKDLVIYQKQYWAEYYYEIDADLNLRCWDTSNNEEMNLADELT